MEEKLVPVEREKKFLAETVNFVTASFFKGKKADCERMVARETIVFKLSAHNRPSKEIDWMREGKIFFFKTVQSINCNII